MAKIKSVAELNNIIRDCEAALKCDLPKSDMLKTKSKLNKAKSDLEAIMSERI